jgi:nucleoside phosphorylase
MEKRIRVLVTLVGRANRGKEAELDALSGRVVPVVPFACDVLILAAFHPELAPLRSLLGEGMSARVGTARPVSVVARVVGIGLPMAAVGTATVLTEVTPRVAVMVGTCGAYAGTALATGDVVVARRLRFGATGVAEGLAQFPDPMSLTMSATESLAGALLRSGGKAGDVVTTPAVTVDDAAADRLARWAGAQAEHLEAYGAAVGCAARGIPFTAVLGVANAVGSRARDEWRTNHRRAAAAAAEVVTRWLQEGAPH